MAVFVLDKQKNPLMPCSEKRARKLLEAQRAHIHRMYPFTIRLVARTGGDTQPLTLKIDPGSKQSGMALVRQTEEKTHVVALLDVKHRDQAISQALRQRAAYRRRRRSANLRYRAPRLDNRRRPKGWLAPSIQHRVDVDESIVDRITQLAPVSALVPESVRFDTQQMEDPEVQESLRLDTQLMEDRILNYANISRRNSGNISQGLPAARTGRRLQILTYSATSTEGERERGRATHAALSLPGINAGVSRGTKMKLSFAVALAAFSIPCFAQSPDKAEIFSSNQLRDQLAQLAQQAKSAGSSGFKLGEYGTHTLMLSERTTSGGAEIHAHFDDVMLVMDGKATLITGGEVLDSHVGANGETTGTKIRNGAAQTIAAGDVIHIPAGTPHQLLIAPGVTYSAVVIKVKE
jgi:mannose-6-phosphate isomerase-like protein (cupin superfamily)